MQETRKKDSRLQANQKQAKRKKKNGSQLKKKKHFAPQKSTPEWGPTQQLQRRTKNPGSDW